MVVKFKGKEVEIDRYSVGAHWDEVCVESACWLDDGKALDEDELYELGEAYSEELIQEKREFHADSIYDAYKEGLYD